MLPDGKDFILTDEIIVLFKEGVSETEKNRLKEIFGVEEIDKINSDLIFYRLKEKSEFNTLEIADKYQKETIVKSSIPNFLADFIKLNVNPNDQYFYPTELADLEDVNINLNGQWALFRICAESGWSFNKGANTRVMVLDTGADLNHPDLKGRIIGDDNNFNVLTEYGSRIHGSAVAGIIGANTNNGIGISGVTGIQI